MKIDRRFCPGDTVWTSEYNKSSGWYSVFKRKLEYIKITKNDTLCGFVHGIEVPMEDCFKSEVIANDATYYRNEALEKSDKVKNEELIKELKRLLER